MSAALMRERDGIRACANEALSSTLRSGVENWKHWRTMSSRNTWK